MIYPRNRFDFIIYTNEQLWLFCVQQVEEKANPDIFYSNLDLYIFFYYELIDSKNYKGKYCTKYFEIR